MQERLRKQYKDDANLNARIQLHKLFSTNPLPWQQWVFGQINLPAQATILELGCGPGTLWVENRGKIPVGWEITLTDFSEGMLEAAQKNLHDSRHNFSFRIVDAQNILFDEKAFDAVIANHMLYHVPDRSQALSEIRRVLKVGGGFYASTIGQRHMQEMWELLQPFVPQILDRSPSSFTLENGASQLTEFFENVKHIDYDDILEITDPEAVISYLRSSSTLVDFPLTDAVMTNVCDKVNEAIRERGAFHVTKASGLFTAARPG